MIVQIEYIEFNTHRFRTKDFQTAAEPMTRSDAEKILADNKVKFIQINKIRCDKNEKQ